MMDDKVIRIIRAYSELSYSERQEVIRLINEYEKKDIDKRKPMIKSLTESLGPLSSGVCPYCGK
jgi:phosphopantothenate synthetase